MPLREVTYLDKYICLPQPKCRKKEGARENGGEIFDRGILIL